MKYVLITGCSGLIGSQSVNFFISKGYHVLGLDNHMREYFFGKDCSTEMTTEKLKLSYPKNFTHYNVDIRDYEEMKKIFSNYNNKIEIVIHTAAQPSHDWASKEPLTDFHINAVGTINLLELTRIYSKAATFIFTSTNKVYGDNPNKLDIQEGNTRYFLKDDAYNHSIDESMSIDNCLHSVFGASKVSADILVQEYGKYFGINSVCFRGGCLTGPEHAGAELHGFLSYLIKCIVNNKKYTIYGYKGKQVRDNIHSWDLVNMFYHFHLSPKKGEVYNAGGGIENSISIIEAINKVNSICKKNIPKWVDWTNFDFVDENRIGDHIYYVTNLNKFKKDYPEWPGITISLDNLIEEITINEIKKNNYELIS
jgi:CDP-paratose 2-epimerase